MHPKEYHERVMLNTCARMALAAGVAICCAPGWQAPPLPPPDVANARYGPHERNVLDVWKAKSSQPAPIVVFIHGGGFTQGDKSGVPPPLLNECLRAGIAVASIN